MTMVKSSVSTKIQQKIHRNGSTATAIKMFNHPSSSCSTMRNISPFFAISLIFIFVAFLAALPKGTEASALFPMMGQNYAESMEGANSGNLHTMNKRRLVVRVPFAQNPDAHQMSRIYKSLFEPSNSRAKKQPWTYSLRHFVAGPSEEE